MRFLAISAALSLPANVLGAPACATSGAGSFMEDSADWYRAIIKVVHIYAVTTPNSIANYFNSLTGTNGNPSSAMATSLYTGFLNKASRADLSSECLKCAFDLSFATMVIFQHSVPTMNACRTAAPDYYVTVAATQSSECLLGLYDAIVEFNTCAGNGYDIVTKAPTQRCTEAEFVPFAIAHNPLSAIAKCSFDDTSLTTASALAACVGASYVADKAALTCEPCFDDLTLGIQALASTCERGDGFDYLGCTGIAALVTDFGTCSGGFTFYNVEEGHCSADQFRVIEAMRPYTNMVKCAFVTGDESLCLDYYNSIRDALNDFDDEQVCSGHFAAFVGMATPANICETTPFAAACIDAISAYQGALYDIQVNTGVAIDTTSTKCSSTQWRAMADTDTSYIPFVRCAMQSDSVNIVLECIESDPLLENVLSTAPCVSCFKQLAIEAYVARTSEVEALCVDPYSAGCVSALAKPFAIFKECSGYDAKIISNGECSASARSALQSDDAGLAKVMDLVANSVTPTEALYEYGRISDALSTTEFPCMYCHLDLITNMFNLSDDDRAICIADFTSWDCYMVMGPSMDNFYRCSRGWSSTSATSIRRDVYA